jgi:hypothetical protein
MRRAMRPVFGFFVVPEAYVRWNSYVESYGTKFIRPFPPSLESQFVVQMNPVLGLCHENGI